MGQLGAKLRSVQNGFMFWCPGCDEPHTVGHGWQFNNDAEKPTFAPSILIRSGHYVGHFDPNSDVCWCTYNKEHPEDAAPFTCSICHSFVRDGQIEFLGDCTHALANQTVDLPDLPVHMQDEEL